MNVLALYPLHDTPGKRDASTVFAPEAKRFAELHEGRAVGIDNRKPVRHRRAACLEAIDAGPMDTLALFCHGTTHSTQLLGSRAQIPALKVAAQAARLGTDRALVVLFCCSTASGTGVDGNGGYADAFRDELCRAGVPNCKVVAHDTVGHATRNPHVRVFFGMGTPHGGVGGIALVARGTPAWRTWTRRLRDRNDELRLRFPLMTIRELHEELARG